MRQRVMEPVRWRKVLPRMLEVVPEHQKGLVQKLAIFRLREVVLIFLQTILVGKVAVHFLRGLDV